MYSFQSVQIWRGAERYALSPYPRWRGDGEVLCWLDAQDFSQAAHSELSLAEKLEGFRKADPYYRDSSFDTICGWAQHGAIIHYRATPETSQTIGTNNLLLLDSGGQYADGTTDVIFVRLSLVLLVMK